MARLYKVCLDIEGNDRGLTITTVAADNKKGAVEKAKQHVGVMNQNVKDRKIDVKGCKEIGEKGCYSGESIPRDWIK